MPRVAKPVRHIVDGVPEKVVDAIVEALAVEAEEITKDAHLVEDLGADSLDVVELSMALEQVYGLQDQAITDADVETWGTVKDVLKTLRKRGAQL